MFAQSGGIDTIFTNGFFILKILFVVFSIVYFLFSLVLVRQIFLMTDTVITEGGPLLRFFAILFAGVALGIVILFIGFI
jgi:hypothetical protein